MRIAIVGGGVAGALLAWRLSQQVRRVSLTIYTAGRPGRSDASGASGGMVRGFEETPATCGQAAESLAEVYGSAALQDWTGYRETGSVYLMPGLSGRPDPVATSLAMVEQALPGSATVLGAAELGRRYPFRDLPRDSAAVVERQAGFISPHRLRACVLAELGSAGATIDGCRVRAVAPGAGAAPRVALADGNVHGHDIVVLAAGAWTPGLLRCSRLPGQQMRTKHIQYSVCSGQVPGLGAFVDNTTGLYGRTCGPGSFLVGLPSDRWNIDPGDVRPDPGLRQAAVAHAQHRLGARLRPVRTVASSDCFRPDGGLALHECASGSAVFTFSAGSGGAAKTVIAASRAAAAALTA